MRPCRNHSKILLKSQGKQRGMITEFLKDSSYTWGHLRPTGTLQRLARLLWDCFPILPWFGSIWPCPNFLPPQEIPQMCQSPSESQPKRAEWCMMTRVPFPRFHLSPCENTSSFLFTEGFYSRNLFARQFFGISHAFPKTSTVIQIRGKS